MSVYRLLSIGLLALLPGLSVSQDLLSRDRDNPIEAASTLWTEEMTWMEVRDALREGATTIIIGTGGIEQNGPYVVGGKHNYVLQTVLPYIAEKIGNALIAPIVKFVPEGAIDPVPTGHMQYPGTISVEQETFEALLRDICRSYAAHGFIHIVLLGDSGGNQEGMQNVANALNKVWADDEPRVHYLREFYSEDSWSYEFLKSRGLTQIDRSAPEGEPSDRPAAVRNGIHDDIYYEAQLAVLDPAYIRMEQRQRAGLFELHGVALDPVDKLVELGHELAQYRAEITARAFAKSKQRLRPASGS